jgi:hypothetical protein
MIFADAAEPKSIEEIYRSGFNIHAANKDVWAGIVKVKSFPLYLTDSSTNLKREIQSYKWKKDKEDNIIEEPVKANDDACFIGSTMITTINGQVRIDKINVGDLVLTSKGYKKVLAVHNNGLKQVNKYLMQLDMFSVSLCCTSNHLVYTQQSWTEISKLKLTQTVSHIKHLMAENLPYTMVKDILPTDRCTCIGMYGNTLMSNVKKATISTIKMVTHGITKLTIWSKLKFATILANIVKTELNLIPKSLKSFTQKVLNRLKNGIEVKKAESGIEQKQLHNNLANHYQLNLNVNIAELTILPKQSIQSSAIQTAKLKHLDCGISWKERVYDLTIEEAHEYFANGVLVHNCDATRYAIYNYHDKPKFTFIPRETW